MSIKENQHAQMVGCSPKRKDTKLTLLSGVIYSLGNWTRSKLRCWLVLLKVKSDQKNNLTHVAQIFPLFFEVSFQIWWLFWTIKSYCIKVMANTFLSSILTFHAWWSSGKQQALLDRQNSQLPSLDLALPAGDLESSSSSIGPTLKYSVLYFDSV